MAYYRSHLIMYLLNYGAIMNIILDIKLIPDIKCTKLEPFLPQGQKHGTSFRNLSKKAINLNSFKTAISSFLTNE